MQDVIYSTNLAAFAASMLDREKIEEVGRKLGLEISPSAFLMIPLYGIFSAQDGKVAIAALTDKQAHRFFTAIGAETLAEDERFSNIVSRVMHVKELTDMINKFMSKMKRDEIIEKLIKERVPCGKVYEDLAEIKNDEQLKARGMFVDLEYKGFRFPLPGVSIKLSESPGLVSVAPEVGQHTEEILCEVLKYQKEEMKRLRSSGVIF